MGVRPSQGPKVEPTGIWEQQEASEHLTLMAKAIRTKRRRAVDFCLRFLICKMGS